MAKINEGKDGKRYLKIEVSEYTGPLRSAIDHVFVLKAELRKSEAIAVALHDEQFPELLVHQIKFQWGAVNVGLDSKRQASAKAQPSPLSLADFLALQGQSGRRA